MNRYNHIPLLLCAVIATTLCGCHKTKGRTLTSATGSVYECLVVMQNNALSQNEINQIAKYNLIDQSSPYSQPIATTCDLVDAVMAAGMPCLPQVEPYFKLTHVQPAAFDDMLKPTRNILIIDIDNKQYTQTKAKISTNYWSKPQAIYRIQTPSQEQFVTYWLTHGQDVRLWFVQQEIDRQIRFYNANTNKQARKRLQQMGYDMLIPEDYLLIMDTTLTLQTDDNTYVPDNNVQLLWCCNNKGSMRKDIVIYNYPYTNPQTFTINYLNQQRDAVLGKVITATVEGSHMGTEYKVIPPQMRDISVQHGQYAAEIRGLWKMRGGEAMGGPYVSHTRLDQVNGRVITAETFIFAPGQNKRTALRQNEAILYTLQLPQDTIKP